ncbi:EpsG family protein [Aeromonas caviae]
MIYYFYAFSLTLIFSNFYSSIFQGKKAPYTFNKLAFLGMLLPLALLSGLRATSVGTDTLNYFYLYHDVPSNIVDFFNTVKLGFFDEPGFKIIQFIFRFFGLEFNYFLCFISTFIVYLYLRGILINSKYKKFSVLIFLTLGFYTFHFNGARQGIAMAIFFYSLLYAVKGEGIKFYSCLFVGFLFHKSIIFCLPVFILIKSELTPKKIILLFVVTSLLALFVDDMVAFASENIDARYSSFSAQRSEAMGLFYHSTNFLIFIFLYLMKVIYRIKERLFNSCLNLALIGVILGLVSIVLKLDPNGIARASYYFTQLYIYLIPIAVYSITNMTLRSFCCVLSILLGVTYFYLTTTALANLYPYSFFFNT